MPVQIIKLQPNDIHIFKNLIQVFEEVFEMNNFKIPSDHHLMQLLNKEDFIVFVALSENKVLGGLTAYSLQQYYSVLPLVFIYDIAIKAKVQRQGIGKSLISHLSGYCKEKGYEEMFVLADETDIHALDFYRSTHASESKVVNFNYIFNE